MAFFIQEYRITPLSSTIPSPAEILFGRRFRSNLSILPSQLTNSRTAYICKEIAKKENKLHEKPTPVADLVPGQPIWHQDPLTKKWLPGAVQEKLQEPHSYSITSQDTTTMYRRNRNHLKPDKFQMLQPMQQLQSLKKIYRRMNKLPSLHRQMTVSSQVKRLVLQCNASLADPPREHCQSITEQNNELLCCVQALFI